MSVRGKLLTATLVFGVVSTAFIVAQVNIATKAIQFDLKKIGESVYEARQQWQVADANHLFAGA